MEILSAPADLQLHHPPRHGFGWRVDRRAKRLDGLITQHPVALVAKAPIYRCRWRQALDQKGPAQPGRKSPKPCAAGDLAGDEGRKP